VIVVERLGFASWQESF